MMATPPALASRAQANTSARNFQKPSAKTSPGVIKAGAQPLRIPRDVSRKAQIDKSMAFLTSLPRTVLVCIISLWIGLKAFFQRAVAGLNARKVTNGREDELVRGRRNREVKSARRMATAKKEGPGATESRTAQHETAKKKRKRTKKGTKKAQGEQPVDIEDQNADPNINNGVQCDAKSNDSVESSQGSVAGDDIQRGATQESETSDDVGSSKGAEAEDGQDGDLTAAKDNNEGWVEYKSKASRKHTKKQSRDTIPIPQTTIYVAEAMQAPKVIETPTIKTIKAEMANTADAIVALGVETSDAEMVQTPKAIAPPTTDALDVDAVENLDMKTTVVEPADAKAEPDEEVETVELELAEVETAESKSATIEEEIIKEGSVAEETVQIDAEEDQIEKDGVHQQDEPTELPDSQEEIEETAEVEADSGIDMSTEPSEQDFTETPGDKDIKPEANTEMSAKDGEAWEEAPKPAVEQEWTEIAGKKKKQKKTSPASILATPSKAAVTHASLTRTPSPAKGSKNSPRHSLQRPQSISSPIQKSPSKLSVPPEPQFVDKDWNIKTTNCWAEKTGVNADAEVHENAPQIAAASLLLSIPVQEEPVVPLPTADSENESPVFSPVLEQAESSAPTSPELGTTCKVPEGEEKQEAAIESADLEEESQAESIEEGPTTPRNNRFCRSAPSTLQRERRRTPRVVVPLHFTCEPAIGSYSLNGSGVLSLNSNDVADTPTKLKNVSTETMEKVEESAAVPLEADELARLHCEESSAVTPQEVDDATPVLSEEFAKSTQDETETSAEPTKAAKQDAEDSPQTSAPEVETGAHETSVNIPEVDDAAEVPCEEVEEAVQNPIKTTPQKPKAAETSKTPTPNSKSKFDQPWRRLDNNAPASSNSTSNSSSSSNWRPSNQMLVLGRSKEVEEKPEVPVVASKPEETKPAWFPASGRLWSDEADEDDEEYKAAFPALG